MRVGIILTNLYPGKIGGAEQYVRNTIHEMASMSQLELFLFVNGTAFPTFREEGCARVVAIEDAKDRDVQLNFWIDDLNIDIMFCPLFFIAPDKCPVPAVASILDIQHEFFPHYFSKKVLADIRKSTADTLSQADGILTISEYSKQTIVDQYQVASDKICVTYLNSDRVFELPLDAEKKDALKRSIGSDYIFYPANSWPHKNHLNLLKAYAMLKMNNRTRLKLVFTGDGKQQKKDIEQYILGNHLEQDVIYLGYLPQEEMPYIFANATVMAFPSVFEGFGIPLVEAMRANVAIACSRCGSIPEVAQDAALYFDADDPQDIADKLYLLETNEKLRSELIQKGREAAKQYSWRKCARDTAAYLEQVWKQKGTRRTPRYNEMPLVSIITPSYNQGEFIKETIESVLKQDYTKIEYLVMDGGSTDQTIEILKSYGDRIQWVSEQDGGQADAVNRGIRRTKGAIIGWLNSDDTYQEGAVTKIVAYMQSHPDTDMVYGQGYYIDKNGNMTGRYPTEPFDRNRLAETCLICQPAAFFTKKIVEQAGMLDVGHQLSMDYELWMRIAKTGKISYLPQYIAASRMYEENKTLSRRKEVFEETCQAVKKHYHYVPISWVDGYADYLAGGSRGVLFYWHDFRLFFKYNITNRSYFWCGIRTLCRGRCAGLFGIRKIGKKAAGYTGRYPDLWLSKEYIQSVTLNGDQNVIKLVGKHHSPMKRALKVKVFFDGEKISKFSLRETGDFVKEAVIPDTRRSAGGHTLKLVMNATFCPARIAKSNDQRELSLILNDVILEERKR